MSTPQSATSRAPWQRDERRLSPSMKTLLCFARVLGLTTHVCLNSFCITDQILILGRKSCIKIRIMKNRPVIYDYIMLCTNKMKYMHPVPKKVAHQEHL